MRVADVAPFDTASLVRRGQSSRLCHRTCCRLAKDAVMPRKIVTGPDLPKTKLCYSPAVKAGPFVFVSGQASVDANGEIVPDTFAAEFRRSFDNVRTILAAAGLTLDDVVKVTSYLARQSDLAEYNELYREIFNDPPPARTTITNCLGDQPVIQYEVDVIAYKE